MKANFLNQPLSLIALFLLFTSSVFAKKNWENADKTIEKSFTMNSDAVLDFSNKYGDIRMTSHEGNEVMITIKISLEGRESKVVKQIENIDVKFSHSAGRLEAKTIVPNSSYQNLQIDWEVKFPISNELQIRNMYGDLHINESKAKTDIDVSYGDVFLGTLHSKENNVEIQYGKGRLKEASYLDLRLRYSEMDEIGKVKLLNLDAMYSESSINSVGRLNLKSAYDEHEINAVAELNIDAMYTDIHVGTVTMKLDCDMTYGDIRVNKISKSFDLVDYDGAYSDARLGFESGSTIDLEARASYGDIDLPSGKWNKSEKITSTSVNGSNGEGGKPVRIEVSFGDVKITTGS
jgi:hypothetical protein